MCSVLTLATVSDWMIPCLARLAMSSALVFPVHLQAIVFYVQSWDKMNMVVSRVREAVVSGI